MMICPICRGEYPKGAGYCSVDGHKLEDEARSEDTPADPFIGMLINDRYRVESRLGHGGMGVVYASRHITIDRQVAIKILRYEFCSNEALVERFMREAKAASKIDHPGIVNVTDFGKLADGHVYFVMEYLAGITLADELKRLKGPLGNERLFDLTLQMCQALSAAHAEDIVHRDLKPENIFIINPSNETCLDVHDGHRYDFVKLLDFGIAKMSRDTNTRLTKAGTVFGTPQYMAPEQAKGVDGDHRSDIYSLGCIIYEMATGQVPFASDTYMGTLTKQMYEDPVAPRELRPDLNIPPQVEHIILRAMAKEPEDRFTSMSELAAAVMAAESGDQSVVVEVPVTRPRPEAAPGPLIQLPSLGEMAGIEHRQSRMAGDGGPGNMLLPIILIVVCAGLLGGYLALKKPAAAPEERVVVVVADAAPAQPIDAMVKTVHAERDQGAVAKLVQVTIRSIPRGAQVLSDTMKRLGKTPLVVNLPANSKALYILNLKKYKDTTTMVEASEKDSAHRVTMRRRRPRQAGGSKGGVKPVRPGGGIKNWP